MTLNLIAINGQSRVSSETISESIGTNYKSTIRLIKMHMPALETFGEVRFEIAVGKRKTLAYLIVERALISGMAERLPYKIIYQQAKREVETFSVMVVETCLPATQEAAR